MLRFLPIMFASGRVSYNRMLVTIMDFLIIYSLYLSFTGVMHWSVGIFFSIILAAFYIRVSYTRHFRLVQNHKLIQTSIAFDGGFTSVSLLVKPETAGHEPVEISVPVKVAMGAFYQRYVLYIYMSLCSALTRYARILKTQEDAK
ncbi:hypothetical protein KKJ25_19840 [Xenorhabdus bovienii]|uniref:hypothetical protein n=1 Tax=Xenorhabdus bovienii TaxID=40576 RepID=UPI00237CA5D1|nr:hypothetical protein [Xenorhabdus bovienii]MDE1497119.1 hypothetical protein [Xenorhabdus bovienii]